MGFGALAEQVDVGLLAFKTRDAVLTVLLAAGVLGAADWSLRSLGRQDRGHPLGTPWASRLVAVVLTASAAAVAGHAFAEVWVTGRPALVAQTTRDPDGSAPLLGVRSRAAAGQRPRRGPTARCCTGRGLLRGDLLHGRRTEPPTCRALGHLSTASGNATSGGCGACRSRVRARSGMCRQAGGAWAQQQRLAGVRSAASVR